ncbi:hypothetical protein M0R45_005003 [Rubus argutus]|uniref:Uncharacterized protein n=1 Tax=Rubus argutus TaxID=59490 RepID=A0AAW1YL97_RUBAR
MLSKEENSKLRDILKQALNEANVAKEAAAIARAENSQLKDSLEEREAALNFLTRENENYRVNEIAANENIKELKRLLIESSQKDCKREEREKPPLRDVKKEAKEKTPTRSRRRRLRTQRKSLGIKHLRRSRRRRSGTKHLQRRTVVRRSHQYQGRLKRTTKRKPHQTRIRRERLETYLAKFSAFSLKELKISNSHDDVGHDNDNDDEIEIDEALKGSIFEIHSPGSATHHRRNSSTFTEDGEPLHPDDFDHLDGNHAENSRKKKALLRRFGDLIKRSTTYTYAKKEPSPDPKSQDAKKEPSQDTKKEPSQEKEALPE